MTERQLAKAPLQLLVFNGDSTMQQGCCAETVKVLQQLLTQARRGNVKGLALAVLHVDGRYSPMVTDDARLNPTFARGMVRAIDDLLADIVRGYI